MCVFIYTLIRFKVVYLPLMIYSFMLSKLPISRPSNINALFHHVLLCKCCRITNHDSVLHTSTYPYGGGCDLEVVQPAQGALSVCEVGGSQLVEGFQSHCACRVRVPAAALGPRRRRLQAELPFVHKYCQRLLPW